MTTFCGETNLGTTPLGNGPLGPDNSTIIVQSGATVRAGNSNAISLRDRAIITLGNNATVTSVGATGGTNGLWAAGKNTIEFNSGGMLTIGQGATVSATGSSTNAEAVNLIGEGNSVINHGTISAINTAAIWFEDREVKRPNTIDNFGVIRRGSGTGTVTDNTIGNQLDGPVHFINEEGAFVYGGLFFANGNDTLELFPTSVVTGGFNGGGGTNTLTLNGESGSSDALPGSISNFQTLTKTGGGMWTLTGTVSASGGAPLTVLVQQGTLVLTGNNGNFNGSVTVSPAGILEARAQSLPPRITDNGLVRFAQPDNGTYAGVISGSGAVAKTGAGVLTLSGVNSYSGGTTIEGGTIAINADPALGTASGSLTLNGGGLLIGSSFNLSPSRAITITANDGTIGTAAGVTSVVSQGITGAGSLTKDGGGTLVLAGANGYQGGTTIAAGTLQLGLGGTTGSILGDVVDNGTLAFNRSDTVTFDGTISGSGSVVQAGPGITVLTGDNSYGGSTTIANGWLYVNGDQSAAEGPTTALGGTRLGGAGIVGGDVTIGDNATLAPGAVPQTPATLTINGNLNLNENSILFYNMVEANVDGGALNDLTVVNGDLTLDGVINVVDTGQDLGPGVYRVIDYTGNLTNNGLTIGSYAIAPATPQDPATPVRPLTGFSVQTSIPNQVNLVNTGGLALNYWDGQAGPKNSGTIDGGNGFWQAQAPNDNWTTPTGDLNAPWIDGGFAIFLATPGTVTVDNSLGAVRTVGMQFATDGYVVTGQPITLLPNLGRGSVSSIRVGDGSVAGVAMTATIDAVLTGAPALLKDDIGTLILNGANSYAGGTQILGGRLQISSDVNLGAASTEVFIANGSGLSTTATFSTDRLISLGSTGIGGNGGAFITAAGTSLTLTGQIVEDQAGALLAKSGEGTLIIQNQANYSGGTLIGAGTVQIGNGGTTGSILGNVIVASAGSLAFNHSNDITFGGIIAGSGSVSQIGVGAVVLTGTSTYTGGTTIASGTLQLGAGSTTGSIVGNVANNGTLTFNRSNDVTFAGAISGTGAVNQIGAGTTVLAAANSYAGATTVGNGALFVNGDQTAATGATTVNIGATLGGVGTIGGDATIGAGTLSPGDNLPAPGTLTVRGNLNMGANSVLEYSFGQANVAGGPLNDLTNVGGAPGGGNLVLDGTLNVTLAPGGTMDTGIYRVINYTGTLADNTLELGTMPSGAGPFFVQTSVANQVNLVNTSGLTLNFWDVSPKNDGGVNGGTGTWENGGILDNWTDENGGLNAPWSNGAYAIFMGAPGTVTVSTSTGPINVTGMQFAVDGYTVTAGEITLLNGAADIRVGDGTTAGAGMTTTIASVLAGGAAVVKKDLGTLVLQGANTYTGGTVIEDGVLQISADHNLGAASGSIAFDGGALHTTADITTARAIALNSTGTFVTDDATTLTVTSAVTGAGALTKMGDGTLVLANDNTYAGGTTIGAGILQIGSGATAGSIAGNVANDGTLIFNRSDSLTFAGTVSGTGSLVQAGSGTTVLTADSTYTGGTTISAGTLQLGDGGTTGSIVGNVTNDGTLVFSRSDTLTFGGTIAGGGSVGQIGTGTTVLTANNTYTGGTTISSGILQLGNGGTTGSIIGNVTNEGTLVFDRSDTLTFGGIIAGGGSVSQIGTGTTVLAADNTYTGGTTITSGTLQLGNGGTTGGIVGDVVNSSTLIVDRSNEMTLAGQISGSGQLIQQGTGTTILTGNNSYGGGTQIIGGTLQLGNGGATGSILGDILNSGTLAVDRSDLLPIGGVISGTGSVVQQGTGTTALQGDNSYTGPTQVNAGTLFVNGNQSAATGATSVASGATLGGIGTIGGGVAISDDATLSPGDVGTAPGTLTINGDLALTGGSLLSYSFGQANVVGGPLNDLTRVQGDLVLDGTLNVETSAGGSFDPGIYRVISYAGELTNNGLAIGTIPSPDFFVQTTIPSQVNLINFAGLELNFWDGEAGPKDDSVVNGGDGTWQNFSGNDNWTNVLGVPNAPFADASFAIFSATRGVVTVDDSLGSVNVSGMQFASDGYVIRGEAVTLVASPAFPNGATIRVGDGTSEGAGYTTTIDSVLTGTPALVKTDLGTLVLAADNSYAGGTAINGGVVQIASDTNLGAAGTPLGLDSGTLRVTANVTTNRATTLGTNGGTFEVTAGAVFTQAATIGGGGSLTKTGAGTAVLTAANSYSGFTMISAGTLQLGDGGTSGSIVGNVIDDSRLVLNRSDVATFAGAISGFGSVTQAGTGTTILTGPNTYEGGTTISAGTLQLGNGGTTGSIIGDVLDNGTLAFNRADVVRFEGAISGVGAVAQIGSGTTILTSTGNSWSGPTMVAAGTLQAGAANTFSRSSQFAVAPGATLDLAGFDQTIAGLTNSGLVRIGGAPGTTLTVVGDYIGVNGTLAINTHLGDDSSISDRLVIDGGRGDDTSVIVTNVGGAGAQTTGDGILVVDAINGATTTPTAFSLGAPAVAGPYEYSLFRGGLAGGSPDDWFLRSTLDCALAPTLPVCDGGDPPSPPPNFRRETSLYAAIPSLALRYGNAVLSTLDERMGGRRSLDETAQSAGGTGPDFLAWGRILGQSGDTDGGDLGVLGGDGPSYDYDLFALQTGMDVYRAENANGSFDNAGAYFAYGRTTADVTHFDGLDAGSDALNGWTIGGYWTHYGSTGWYLDGVVQGTWYDITASGRLPDVDTDGFGFGTSLEGGYPFQLGGGLVLEPQAQLTYQTIDLDDTSDIAAQIRFDDVESLVGRLGVRLSGRWDLDTAGPTGGDGREVLAWIRASVLNEFLGEPETQFSSADGFVPFASDINGASIKIDAGFDAEVTENISVYGNALFQQQFDGGDHVFGGELGLKARF